MRNERTKRTDKRGHQTRSTAKENTNSPWEKKRSTGTTKPLSAMTPMQKTYISNIKTHDLNFCIGPAGTGKTYIAASLAAQALANGDVDKIIITRPVVEAGENLGFLPGDIDEKFEPYLAPVRDILEERLGQGFVEYALKAGSIIVRPMAYLRGHTFKNAFVLLDESQNTTTAQMYLFLTRIGENAKVIIDGDLKQKDITARSGLTDAIEKLGHHEKVSVTRFSTEDIVRSGLVRDIIEIYSDEGPPVGQDSLSKFLT